MIWQALFEIFVILMLLLLNGFFAFAEIAVVSSSKVRLQQMAQQNHKAALALQLAKEPANFLSTVQVGITLVGILAGAFSGARLARKVAPLLAEVPLVSPYADVASFVLVVVIVTYCSLIIGELLPKDLALSNPERAASQVARSMTWLSRIVMPIVRFLSWSTAQLRKLLRLQIEKSPPVTEEEVKALVAEGAEAGIFEQREQRLVVQALELDDISLHGVLTPFAEIQWLNAQATTAQIRRQIVATDRTWFPLCDGKFERLLGVVQARETLLALADSRAEGAELEWQRLVRDPIFIPLTTTPVNLLDHFRSTTVHVAFVVDAEEQIVGIVTPFDVLEALVGALEP